MSIEHLKQALREKTAAGMLSDNENETVPGRLQVRKDPEGYKRNEVGGNVGFSTAANEEAHEGREEMARRLFGNALGQSASTDQATIRSLFNAETVRDAVPSHSLTLRHGHTKTASVEDETLIDQVVRVTGMR